MSKYMSHVSLIITNCQTCYFDGTGDTTVRNDQVGLVNCGVGEDS